jgi:hypothetical protein
MEASTAIPISLGRRRFGYRLDVKPLASWLVSFVVVTYLALSDGGFDTVSRSQAGVAVWWIVLLGAAVGILPRRVGRAGWLAVGLLVGFAAWTGLSISGSQSAELSADELGRVATYAGVFLLALTVQRWSGARAAVYGAAAAVGVVGLLAVLSRLHPAWFPVNQQLAFFSNAGRLSYPLNYWNGLAAFLGMGVPLLLCVASDGRRVSVQALGAAGVPVLALGIFFTISRGGAIALGIGPAAYLLLSHDRIATLASLAACGSGSAILIAYADARPALQNGTTSAASTAAGNRMLPILLLVCAGVALLQVAIGLAARHAARPRWLEPPRRQGAIRVAGVIAALVVAAVVAGVPGKLDHAWQDFKRPPGAVAGPGNGDVFSRLQSAAGHDRYQYWTVAAKAAADHPLAGTGAGTFVLLWARNANAPGHVQDAHSLYMQTLAETGYPGLLLLGGMLLTFLIAGAVRTLRAPPERRFLLAAATAAVAVFCTTAAFEWVWQLGAVASLMLVLGAVCVAGGDRSSRAGDRLDASGDETPVQRKATRRAWLVRGALALVAGAAIVAISLPMAAAEDLASSQAAARRGDLSQALADARSAERVQPYAASARLQEALVRERLGDLAGARAAATTATREEPTNWQTWIVLSRIEAELGRGHAALADFARARSLDPQGILFHG